MVCHWMSTAVEDDAVIHDRLGHAVGKMLGVFWAENGIIGSRDPEWLQGALNVLIGLIHQIGLMENFAKSQMMMCQLGEIRLGMSEEVVGWKSTGKRYT